jgi:hypothetical protein
VPTPTEINPLPALYGHCVEVYDKLLSEAVPLPEDEDTTGLGTRYRWQGFATKLIRDLGLAVPHYTQVRRALLAMDCIRQEKRGGGSAPSTWILLQPPSTELWLEHVKDTPAAPRSAGGNSKMAETLEQQNRDLNKRVSSLDQKLDLVTAMVNDAQERLKKAGL